MDDKFENDEDIKSNINNEDIIYNNNKRFNLFISFMENYYGTFKQYLSEKEIFDIGKINKKLMSLVITDIGHNLYEHKNEKKEKMRQIINDNASNEQLKDENINDKIKVNNFMDSINMKRILTYLKRREYIEAFKSIEPTVTNELLEIYKLFYIIINNQKMVNLFENSKERFWKKMADEFVRNSFDGENLNKYIYKLLLDKLSFEPSHVFKVNYLWKKFYENQYDIKDITGKSPTTGIFFLIIKEYLEWCGIIESRKSDHFILCNILKLDILNINEKLIKTAKFFNKLNYENNS